MNYLNRLTSLPPLGQMTNSGSGLPGLGLQNVPYYGPYKWIAVRPRFEEFNRDLALTGPQQRDGVTKRDGVVGCLNRHYYGTGSGTDNSFLIGSWGKNTAMRPPRDVDVYFVLPPAVYYRFQDHKWNRQSALLQEVKEVLGESYPDTDMRGDGQVVVVGSREPSMWRLSRPSCWKMAVTGFATPMMEAPTRRLIRGRSCGTSMLSTRRAIRTCGRSSGC